MRIKHSRLTPFRLILLLLVLTKAVEVQGDAYSEFTSTPTAAASIELYGTFHAMGVIATAEYCTGSQAYQARFPLSRVDDTRFGVRRTSRAACSGWNLARPTTCASPSAILKGTRWTASR